MYAHSKVWPSQGSHDFSREFYHASETSHQGRGGGWVIHVDHDDATGYLGENHVFSF